MALSDFDQLLQSGWGSPQQPIRYVPGSMVPTVTYSLGGNYPTMSSGGVPAPINSSAPTMAKFNLAGLFNGGAAKTASSVTPGMVQTTKSSAMQPLINSATTQRATNAGTEQQSLKDYAAQVLGSQPQAQAAANQEVNSINQIYGTGGDSLQAQLAALNRQEQAAANIAAQRAMSGARRGYNAARAGAGGGTSSYLDRLLAQNLYGIGAQNAGRAAQQGRSDLTWLTGQRTGQVGQRQNILDTLAQRQLAPVFAGQQIEQGSLGNLGRLADLDYGNNIYETPEDSYRRRLDFLDYLSPYAQPGY